MSASPISLRRRRGGRRRLRATHSEPERSLMLSCGHSLKTVTNDGWPSICRVEVRQRCGGRGNLQRARELGELCELGLRRFELSWRERLRRRIYGEDNHL